MLEYLYKLFRYNHLGLILDATVMGLKREKEVDISNLPRMGDFATWVVACETALPWKEGVFMKVYRQANDDAIVDLLDCDSFASAVIKLANDTGKTDLTPTNLWMTLKAREGIDERHFPLGWPKSVKGIKNKLKRLSPQLRKVGVGVEFSRSGKSRNVRIWSVARWGDKFSDNRDDAVTTQNQPPVTAMTSMTTQSIFSLEREKERGRMERKKEQDVYLKTKTKKYRHHRHSRL